MRTPKNRTRIFVGLIVVGLMCLLGVISQTSSATFNFVATRTDAPPTTLPCGSVPDEFPDPTGGGPFGIAAGADGNLWFTQMSNKIGQITPLGIVTEFTLPGADSPTRGITAGPDGNLWFTETDSDRTGRIGRITPTGEITEFTVRLGGIDFLGIGLEDIAAGPDGNLWFTGMNVNGDGIIGRITPTGNITEFGLPTQYSYPSGITAGPNGALELWFTEHGEGGNIGNGRNGRIGRITTDGVLTEYALPPTPNNTPIGPYDITAGPDGNLWFTETNSAQIGRITPAGIITEFAITFAGGSRPVGITAGPDGNLWFVEDGGRIGRITTAGVITEVYDLGSSSGLKGITVGPDGALWFTEHQANKIGRICPPPTDADGDGIPDDVDNCPAIANADQTDTDGDGTGDACDSDDDGDGVADDADNCPLTANADQLDTDSDGQGNACDSDDDGDGDPDTTDCAPLDPAVHSGATEIPYDGIDQDCNGFDLTDVDQDGHNATAAGGDDCNDSNAAIYPGATEVCDGLDNDCDGQIDEGFPNTDGDSQANCVDSDDDNDGVPDINDNCPLVVNPNQTDADNDGVGDACDPDYSQLSINDVAMTEGNKGTKNFTFTVTLSPARSVAVTVQYATANGTALSGSDYNSALGTLTIPAGNTSGIINLGVKGDTTPENDETFNINLSNATNAVINDGQGTGTIQNDDPASADLIISKSAPSGTFRPGDQISYTIAVTNNGPSPAQSVVMMDNLPSQVTFVSCGATNGGVCGVTGNNRTVTFATLASGATATITLVAQINAGVSGGTKIANTADVSGATPDPNTRNNTSKVTLTTARK